MRDPHFRHLLVLALMATGCSGNKAPANTDPVGVTPIETMPPTAPVSTKMTPGTGRCDEALVFNGAMNPAIPGAPLELRGINNEMGNPGQSVVASDGVLCQDDAACATAAEGLWGGALIRNDCGQIGCRGHQLVTSTAGTPSVLTQDTLLAYLGPIDTAAEARLLAWSKGFNVSCSPALDGQVYVVQATQDMSDCPIQTDTVSIQIDAQGVMTETARTKGELGPCVGRLPPGVHSSAKATCAGAWLAHAAEMEASSAHAFQVLAGELAAHGAPEALVQWALRAEQEELGHARTMAALAAHQGFAPAAVPLPQLPHRGLMAMLWTTPRRAWAGRSGGCSAPCGRASTPRIPSCGWPCARSLWTSAATRSSPGPCTPGCRPSSAPSSGRRCARAWRQCGPKKWGRAA